MTKQKKDAYERAALAACKGLSAKQLEALGERSFMSVLSMTECLLRQVEELSEERLEDACGCLISAREALRVARARSEGAAERSESPQRPPAREDLASTVAGSRA